MSKTTRIAMWSGPRNISTAMMRSWESRNDTTVVDEPLYAHYLSETGIEHPGQEDILNSQSTDWREVTNALIQAPIDPPSEIFYQKHMAHHQLPNMDSDWILSLQNCFLIRDPDAVVASYAEKRPNLTPADLGFEQQVELFNLVRSEQDVVPIVIDSELFLENPKQQLQTLCSKLGVSFQMDMLEWSAGNRDSDGVWAKYWYHNVEKSIGFAKTATKKRTLSPDQQSISDQCRPYYEKLKAYCLRTHE